MLKRYQVLLPEWLGDYADFSADEYDLSFSEIIRTAYCFTAIVVITNMFPEYKPGIKFEEIYASVKELQQNKAGRDELHKLLSKIYFEARKAVEYRMGKEKKLRKK
ncbi:MAG: hypothetical protein GTO16_11125 [Candidatus Aminicenantes bacterium]|nr:hypothetical protein [Candidatus Aminicenantes bacterium]